MTTRARHFNVSMPAWAQVLIQNVWPEESASNVVRALACEYLACEIMGGLNMDRAEEALKTHGKTRGRPSNEQIEHEEDMEARLAQFLDTGGATMPYKPLANYKPLARLMALLIEEAEEADSFEEWRGRLIQHKALLVPDENPLKSLGANPLLETARPSAEQGREQDEANARERDLDMAHGLGDDEDEDEEEFPFGEPTEMWEDDDQDDEDESLEDLF